MPVTLVPEDFTTLVPSTVPKGPTYPHRRPGRPSALTDENRQRFLLALRAGNHRHVAARLCGLSPRTVEGWIQRGRGRLVHHPPKPEYIEFARMVDEAEAFAEALVERNLVELTKTSHNAALAFLRTRAPERWPRPGTDRWESDEDDLVNGFPSPNITIEQHAHNDTRVLIVSAEQLPDLAHQLIEQQRESRPALPPLSDDEVIDHGATSRHARLDPLRSED